MVWSLCVVCLGVLACVILGLLEDRFCCSIAYGVFGVQLLFRFLLVCCAGRADLLCFADLVLASVFSLAVDGCCVGHWSGHAGLVLGVLDLLSGCEVVFWRSSVGVFSEVFVGLL